MKNRRNYRKQILCPHCDMVSDIPVLKSGEKAVCIRCGTKLYQYRQYDNLYAASYSVAALFFLLTASFHYFIRIDAMGFGSVTYISDIIKMVSRYNVIIFFIFFTLAIPVFCLISTTIICLRISVGWYMKIFLLKWLKILKPWCMAEIFVTGVLVSFVKLANYSNISVSVSFAAFCLFGIFTIKSFTAIDTATVWFRYTETYELPVKLVSGITGKKQGVWLCNCCGTIVHKSMQKCPRCATAGRIRNKYSVQNTIALIISAIIFYIPANYLPVMTTNTIGSYPEVSTIISGVDFMIKSKSYFVGAVIFIASVLIPSFKILSLFYICCFITNKKLTRIKDCAMVGKVYKIVHIIGRWSMIDVFVVTTLAGVVRITGVMSILPETGIVYFALVVMITMFATDSLDPRLIWDKEMSNES